MALYRSAPYKVGESVVLRAADRSSKALVLTAPDGIVLPITGRATVTVVASTVGTWHYSWGQGDVGTFEVADVLVDEDGPPTFINRVEVG